MSEQIDVTPRTRVKRAHNRGVYGRDELYRVIDATILCHVGYVIDDAPYVTPTFHWREGGRVFWHGSSASRMLRTLEQDEVEACLTVTLFDGVVFARSSFNHSANYRSAMIFGTPEPIADADEKFRVLGVFMDRLAPGRWEDCRRPNAQELKATTVLSMPIDEASAKIRSGPPEDDEPDYQLPHWAGVLPITTVIGEPVPDPALAPGIATPDYVRDFDLKKG
ncbi:MAG: pyridoxamine 5'-phosphate oxidase family protein [Rhodospirillales bacterium]